MTMKSLALNLLLLAAAIALPSRAAAYTITFGVGNSGSAILNSATNGDTGSHTLDATDIHNSFGGTGWTSIAYRETDGTSGVLTVNGNPNNWSSPVTGTWEIDSSFWTTYSSAVISIQIGGGEENSENKKWFSWLITPASTNGTWSFANTSGSNDSSDNDSSDNESSNKGGVDRMTLWGSGQGSSNAPGVPDAGSTLALMGIALAGLGLISRTSSRR